MTDDLIKNIKQVAYAKMVDAEQMLQEAVENLPKEVEKCNTFRLTFWLGDAANAMGTAIAIMDLVPTAKLDPEFKRKWERIADLYDKAWRQRDQFMNKCKPPGW